MKKLLVLLNLLLFIMSCSVKQKGADGKAGKDSVSKEIKITPETIKNSMDYLSSDELGGRATGTVGIEKAAMFIENYLKDNGIKPFFETYRDSFEVENRRGKLVDKEFSKIQGYNIVGIVEGNDSVLKNEYVILGGHYDHIGLGRVVNNDSVANGANDDASGTVTAMEIGRYFAGTKTNKRSLLITLYDAEEMGLRGSSHLAVRLKNQGLDLYTMVNFEMVGVPRAEGKSMSYMSGYNKSNLASKLNDYVGEEVVGFFPKAKDFQLFFRSDNYPFYKEFTKPAHAISTFDFSNYEYYHHVDDEADKMNYEHMAEFTNKMIIAFEGILNAPTKELNLNDE